MIKKATLYIKGMHCPSCEILMADKFKEEHNVREVRANFKKQEVEVYYQGSLDQENINKKIQPFGYRIETSAEWKKELVKEPFLKRLSDTGAIAVILFILYFFANELNLIPKTAVGSNLNYLTVFILGLIASTSTCMATSGALFLATVGKLQKRGARFSENIVPAAVFAAGRFISYGFFGFLAGLVGKALVSNLNFGIGLTAFVSVFMVLLGLDMAGLINIGSVLPTGLTKGIFERLEHKMIKHPKKTAFFLGALTYLLPCGFTQTVQVYALGLANPIASAITMMVFVAGTLPALLLVGSLSSLTKTSWYPYFMKTMGVLVFFIGLGYIGNVFYISGININLPSYKKTVSERASISIENGVQVARMTVNATGYSPNSFTVKKNVPVRWIINGENVFGCQGFLVSQSLGINKILQKGDNIIEFTPTVAGTIPFSCTMGMYRGRFEVVEG